MARVSRKARNQPITTEPVERIYKSAIYTRLSVEDNGQDNEGETMATQVAHVQQFVEKQADMELVGIFSDNGWTGTNFERPNFERMMELVRKREIDCIICKDDSGIIEPNRNSD